MFERAFLYKFLTCDYSTDKAVKGFPALELPVMSRAGCARKHKMRSHGESVDSVWRRQDGTTSEASFLLDTFCVWPKNEFFNV